MFRPSQENIETEITDLLKNIYSVIDRSYYMEFGHVDPATGEGGLHGIFGSEKNPSVLIRAALFTEVKDTYDKMSPAAKKIVDFYVKNFYPKGSPSYSKTLSIFIDNKVGGSGENKGLGACLQDATFALSQLHNAIVNDTNLGELFVINRKKYSKMPPQKEERSPTKVTTHDAGDSKGASKESREQLLASDTKHNKQINTTSLFLTMQQYSLDYQKNHPNFLLAKAIHDNDEGMLYKLIDIYSISEITDYKGYGEFYPAFHIACQEGKFNAVKILCEKGFPIDFIDSNGGNRTGLSYAAEEANQEIIDFLVLNGASKTIKDNFGKTPLDWLPQQKGLEAGEELAPKTIQRKA